MSLYVVTWSTKWWGEWKIFYAKKDTWKQLIATTSQLAFLFLLLFAGSVSGILLWRKLAVAETTSLYMKAVALAKIPVPITPIQAMSISMWAGGQELYLFLRTHVLYMCNHTSAASCSWQRQAAKGLMYSPTGGFEDEAKSQQSDWKAKRKCHCYLVGLRGTDSSQTCFSFWGFKMPKKKKNLNLS